MCQILCLYQKVHNLPEISSYAAGLLEPAYRTDSPTYKYIRKLMALPFLPEADIPPMFQSLRDSATTATLRELVKYVADTWVTSTMWPPGLLLVRLHAAHQNEQ